MPCQQCGDSLAMTDQEGGIKQGQFAEEYQCVGCGATGRIKGEAGNASTMWDYTGPAFNDYGEP